MTIIGKIFVLQALIGALFFFESAPLLAQGVSNCSAGAITQRCLCGGLEYSAGFCCSGSWNPEGCQEQWQRAYLRTFEDGSVLDSPYFVPHITPISSDFAVVEENGNHILRDNLGNADDKRSHVLMLRLDTMGVEPQGRFFLRARVRISPDNRWCCISADYCSTPTAECPQGRSGAKMAYAFGVNGTAWVPGSDPAGVSGIGQWKLTDNRGGGSGYQRLWNNTVSENDGSWHVWTWYFKHNSATSGNWNNDGTHEIYIDGFRQGRVDDVPYTINGMDGSFNRISKPVSYFGGGGHLAQAWWYWVDDIEIFRPIGPAAADTVAPAAPVNLRRN